jgi:hypothetical protein
MWARPSLTVMHSAPSVSVADVSGCCPALLTVVAGLCRSFILSTGFYFSFLHVVTFLPESHLSSLSADMDKIIFACIMLYDTLLSDHIIMSLLGIIGHFS